MEEIRPTRPWWRSFWFALLAVLAAGAAILYGFFLLVEAIVQSLN
jgi:hypothetical protein